MFDGSGRRKYVNAEERRNFLRRAMRQRDKAKRSFCLTLFYTGCRISEALNLTRNHFDPVHKSLTFETLKRRKRGVYRSVPIPDNLVTLLAEQVRHLPPTGSIWSFSRTTGWRVVKALHGASGIDGVMASPKGLRHGFGVACVTKSIPLPKVQKWLGHARMETTAIYLDVSGKEERDLAKRTWL